MATLSKHKVVVDVASIGAGDSIAAYLTSAASLLITSTTIGAKERLDVVDVASHLDGTAYLAGTDYLVGTSAVDESGNYQPLRMNAANELLVSATVDAAGDYAEDSASASGDIGIFTLTVRQDTLASSTSADGDYGANKQTALGELYVKDTLSLAQLLLIKADTASIVTSTATTATQTTTTATQSTITASALTALSKAEDAAHSSGDMGLQALAVRKDASGSNVSADGDYASLITWSEGSLKVVDVANAALLQSQVSVAATATALPTTALSNRRSILVQNTGSANIFVGSSTVTATGATTGILVPKGGDITLEAGPAVVVYAITATGTVTANVLEMA